MASADGKALCLMCGARTANLPQHWARHHSDRAPVKVALPPADQAAYDAAQAEVADWTAEHK